MQGSRFIERGAALGDGSAQACVRKKLRARDAAVAHSLNSAFPGGSRPGCHWADG